MPELPDLTVYIEHLDRRVTGETLQDIRLASPFVLRTVSPTIEEVRDRVVTGLRRLAKQIVFELEGGFFVVIHLMVAGRLQWRGAAKATPKGGRHRSALAAFDFASGTLLLTEASRNKRASLRLVRGEDALAALDPGGLEIVAIDLGGFVRQLRESRHTLKRTLTDQRIFGVAPVQWTPSDCAEEVFAMAKTHPPYAPEFRRQMVELVRSGRSAGELAREFGCCSQTIRNWVRQTGRDEGRRDDGLTSSELEELRRLRRENRRLREEREILKKAAVWFARETGSVPGRSSSS